MSEWAVIKIKKEVKDELEKIKRVKGMRTISDVIRWSLTQNDSKAEFKNKMQALSDDATLRLGKYGVIFQICNTLVHHAFKLSPQEAEQFALVMLQAFHAYRRRGDEDD